MVLAESRYCGISRIQILHVRLQKDGGLRVNKCTVFCRNIQRYWILRRLCRSISGPCAHLTWTFSGSILVLHGLTASSGWPSAGCLEVHKCTVFCRNIQRYWILRRLCRSISCSASAEKERSVPVSTQGHQGREGDDHAAQDRQARRDACPRPPHGATGRQRAAVDESVPDRLAPCRQPSH